MMRWPVAWTLAGLVLVVPPAFAAKDDAGAELAATLIPATITAAVFLTTFFVFRQWFPNVYAPRANWLRNAYETIQLPSGLASTWKFLRIVYRVPESEVIDKIGCDAAILLRVYALGVELFAICSFVAIPLLAINATGEVGLDGLMALSMANIEPGSDRLWGHVIGMWVMSFVVYYLLRRHYNEILTITQNFKATRMVKYSVMVRNLPKELCSDEALQAYFKKMYRDTHDAIVVRDIGSLASTTQEYIDVTVGLETARVTWEKAQMDPKLRKAGKEPQRPTMRRLPALTKVTHDPMGMLSDVKDVGKKVDTIDYLTERQAALREQIEALREDDAAKKPTTAGFVTFRSIATANAAPKVLHAVAPGTVEVELAPEAREVFWPGLVMPPLRRDAGSHVVTLLKIPLVWAYIIAILFIATVKNIDDLSKNKGLGWLKFVHKLPLSIQGVIQGLLPVIMLAALMAILPMILRLFAQKAGEPSESAIQAYVFGTHYAYQVVFVFFLTILAETFFDSLDEVIEHPPEFFALLGRTVPASGTFFMSYVMLLALASFPGELARLGPLILQWLQFKRGLALDTEKMRVMEPGHIDYGKLLPQQLVVYLIVLAYANVAPIIVLFGIFYFVLGYFTWKHQLLMVYTTICESGGTHWHRIFKFILIGVAISQATLIGVVAAMRGIKQGPFLAPLLIITYFFYYHFDTKYASTVSTTVVAREVAANVDASKEPPSDEELASMTLAFKQPELVYDLDDILYHSSVRCATAECLAKPPPKETWVLVPNALAHSGGNPYLYDDAFDGSESLVPRENSKGVQLTTVYGGADLSPTRSDKTEI
eukprot:m.176273 g.176273  ORF g.176273 m.176273 type:complete len:825 (+) comp14895_c0_seq19:3120-5594(+)